MKPKKLTRTLIFLFLCLACKSTFAYTPEEGNVTATFGPFFNRTNFTGSRLLPEAPVNTDLGIIANGDVSDHSSLEIALFYMDKLYYRQQGDLWEEERTNVLHITMGYKYWLSSTFSTSLALFSAYPMGDAVTVHNEEPPSGPPFDTSARKTVSYGFDFALQAELWSSGRYALVADARYSLNATKKSDEYADHYGVLIGLRYFIQGKDKNSVEKSH